MDVRDVGRRRIGGRSNVVAAGSVWESRMRIDEGKGGIKVFNGEENDGQDVDCETESKRILTGLNGKRKTWKSEGFDKIPILIAKGRSDSNCDDDGIKKSVIHSRKLRSEGRKEVVEGISVRVSKSRSELLKTESGESVSDFDQSGNVDGRTETDSVAEFAMTAKAEAIRVLDEFGKSGESGDEFHETVEDDEEMKEINMPKVKKTVIEEKIVHSINPKRDSISVTVKKQPPITKHSTISRKFGNPNLFSDEHHRFPETQKKLQSLVDIVMWKEISRSAFVFGVGMFLIISSSYTNGLNISFVSVISYLGLVYLTAVFIYRSIICRGVVCKDDSRYAVREEEAIWLLKIVLPYFNEFLVNLEALFSGDPATTMKMALLLFVLARFGSSITIWKMTKLGFFGVFTVPKIYSSYSKQSTVNGKYTVERIRDAWDYCSYKKGVAAALFTIVWNFSSFVTRIWAGMMLFVAVRCYQQNLVRDDNPVREEPLREK